jgi:hypothetical protein
VIDDDSLGLTTPLFRKHVNPFGKYHFDLERMRQTEGGQSNFRADVPNTRMTPLLRTSPRS